MIELSVCIGSACHIRGSYNVIQTFQQMIEENKLNSKVELKTAFCMKKCENKGVSVSVNDEIFSVQPEQAKEFFTQNIISIL
ncbi:MAG: NADH-quinone oxidoreductase subunit F [Clostridiales bacterium]|nr:MAG: NADH-quinone oxidoreductase subunit F [Clostridiales bacterium]